MLGNKSEEQCSNSIWEHIKNRILDSDIEAFKDGSQYLLKGEKDGKFPEPILRGDNKRHYVAVIPPMLLTQDVVGDRKVSQGDFCSVQHAFNANFMKELLDQMKQEESCNAKILFLCSVEKELLLGEVTLNKQKSAKSDRDSYMINVYMHNLEDGSYYLPGRHPKKEYSHGLKNTIENHIKEYYFDVKSVVICKDATSVRVSSPKLKNIEDPNVLIANLVEALIVRIKGGKIEDMLQTELVFNPGLPLFSTDPQNDFSDTDEPDRTPQAVDSKTSANVAQTDARMENIDSSVPETEELYVSGNENREDILRKALPHFAGKELKKLLSKEEKAAQKAEKKKNKQQKEKPFLAFHKIFEEIAQDNDHDAIRYGDERISYSELNARSNQLSHYLKETIKIKEQNKIAICLERSPEQIIAILAVWKIGGVVVLLDPEPKSHKMHHPRRLLEDSKAKFLISITKFSELLKAQDKGVNYETATKHVPKEYHKTVFLDECRESIREKLKDNVNYTAKPKDIAYFAYTSGSTGGPKGVAIPHEGLPLVIKAATNAMTITPGEDCVYQMMSPIFDAFYYEVMVALGTGCALSLGNPGVTAETTEFPEIVEEHDVTMVTLIPTVWEQYNLERFKRSLKVVSTGESARKDLFERFANKGFEIYNGYGPVEVTIGATFHKYVIGEEVSIGMNPFPGKEIYFIRDKDEEDDKANGKKQKNKKQMLIPANDFSGVGELCIAGIGLADGYYRNGEKVTNEENPTFVELHVETKKGEKVKKGKKVRAFKTGDIANVQNGLIYLLGRNESFMKIAGKRVGYEEVEKYIEGRLKLNYEYNDVKKVIAGARTLDEKRGGSDLVACLVLNDGADVNFSLSKLFHVIESEDRAETYRPSAIYYLEEKDRPKTSASKTDRRALMDLVGKGKVKRFATGEVEKPRYNFEKDLHDECCRILGNIDALDIYESLYHCGFTSMMFMSLQRFFKETLSLQYLSKQFVELPGISSIANLAKQYLLSKAYQHSFDEKTVEVKDGKKLFCFYPVTGGIQELETFSNKLTGEGYQVFRVRAPLLAIHNSEIQDKVNLRKNILTPEHKCVEHLNSVQKQAVYLVTMIRSIQPRGPYCLSGWSYGGLLAYEVALQLQACGEEVAFVGLLDPQAPGGLRAYERDDLFGRLKGICQVLLSSKGGNMDIDMKVLEKDPGGSGVELIEGYMGNVISVVESLENYYIADSLRTAMWNFTAAYNYDPDCLIDTAKVRKVVFYRAAKDGIVRCGDEDVKVEIRCESDAWEPYINNTCCNFIELGQYTETKELHHMDMVKSTEFIEKFQADLEASLKPIWLKEKVGFIKSYSAKLENTNQKNTLQRAIDDVQQKCKWWLDEASGQNIGFEQYAVNKWFSNWVNKTLPLAQKQPFDEAIHSFITMMLNSWQERKLSLTNNFRVVEWICALMSKPNRPALSDLITNQFDEFYNRCVIAAFKENEDGIESILSKEKIANFYLDEKNLMDSKFQDGQQYCFNEFCKKYAEIKIALMQEQKDFTMFKGEASKVKKAKEKVLIKLLDEYCSADKFVSKGVTLVLDEIICEFLRRKDTATDEFAVKYRKEAAYELCNWFLNEFQKDSKMSLEADGFTGDLQKPLVKIFLKKAKDKDSYEAVLVKQALTRYINKIADSVLDENLLLKRDLLKDLKSLLEDSQTKIYEFEKTMADKQKVSQSSQSMFSKKIKGKKSKKEPVLDSSSKEERRFKK